MTWRSSSPISTVAGAGWSGAKNGALLRQVAKFHEVFVTVDKRLHRQQRIPPMLAVITLVAYRDRTASLRPLVPSLLNLDEILPGEVRRVSA